MRILNGRSICFTKFEHGAGLEEAYIKYDNETFVAYKNVKDCDLTLAVAFSATNRGMADDIIVPPRCYIIKTNKESNLSFAEYIIFDKEDLKKNVFQILEKK